MQHRAVEQCVGAGEGNANGLSLRSSTQCSADREERGRCLGGAR